MKYKNLVVGEQVQVKRTHTEDYCQDYFKKGQVFEVLRVDSDGMFKVAGEQFDLDIGYGRPENFRKYKEPEHVQEAQQEVAHQYKVGDEVLVGAEGAGYGCVLPKYADKVCTVVGVRVHGEINLVSITHPDVRNGRKYTSMTKYLTPYKQEPDVPFKEGTIVELKEDTVAQHGENVPFGLYVAHGVVATEGWTILYTNHGGLGRAVVRTELLTKVGVVV